MTAPPVLRHVYVPRGAAREVLECQDDEVLVAGPAGTGKSRACLEKLHIILLAVPNVKALAVRKTMVSLSATGMQTFKEHVAKQSIAAGHVKFFSGNRTEPAAWLYTNGSKLVIGGLDNPMKIMSTEYDLIYIQEANEVTLTDWESCTSRLRNGVLNYQQLLADCNPDSEHHWLYMRWQNPDSGLRMLNAKHTDNPVYYDVERGEYTEKGKAYVLGKLARLTGVRRARLYEGRWATAEGVIYENWDPQIHLVDRFDIPEEWPRYWGIDFGHSHPFVCQWWAEDPDGRLYRYREIHMRGRLVEEHAATMLLASTRRVKGKTRTYTSGEQVQKDIASGDLVWNEPIPDAIITDHDAEGRGTLVKHLGLATTAANKTVVEGIDAVAARLNVQDDGKARLYLLRDSLHELDTVAEGEAQPLCTEAEMPAYVWARDSSGKLKKDTPVKEGDDGCDTMRYVVAYFDLGAGSNARWL